MFTVLKLQKQAFWTKREFATVHSINIIWPHFDSDTLHDQMNTNTATQLWFCQIDKQKEMETGTEGDDTSKKTEEETEAERETGGQAESGRNNVSKREQVYGKIK